MAEDPLARWERPGAAKRKAAEVAAAPLAPYEAFRKESGFPPSRLFFKCGPRQADRALPYGYLVEITTDGWSMISLCFALPAWPGTRLIGLHGECLDAVASAIVAGQASIVEVFDPKKHVPPADGAAIIRRITVSDKAPDPAQLTKH